MCEITFAPYTPSPISVTTNSKGELASILVKADVSDCSNVTVQVTCRGTTLEKKKAQSLFQGGQNETSLA